MGYKRRLFILWHCHGVVVCYYCFLLFVVSVCLCLLPFRRKCNKPVEWWRWFSSSSSASSHAIISCYVECLWSIPDPCPTSAIKASDRIVHILAFHDKYKHYTPQIKSTKEGERVRGAERGSIHPLTTTAKKTNKLEIYVCDQSLLHVRMSKYEWVWVWVSPWESWKEFPSRTCQ